MLQNCGPQQREPRSLRVVFEPRVVRAVISIGHDIGEGATTCGAWSEGRARLGLNSRAEPLVPFLLDRQREVGWSELPHLYGCKILRV